MPVQFSKQMRTLGRSEIRELLKLTAKPEVISFAGGLPAPELFPVEDIKDITSSLIEENGKEVLQYATTEGNELLRKLIAERMNINLKTNISSSEVLIVSGSQQALDFAGKVFIDEGDVILIESPSYLGAINAFTPYGAKYIELEMDEDGLIPEAFENALKTNDRIKFLYTIPDFQNPTGRTLSLERRKKIVEIANKYNLPIIEDNPYGELRFEGEVFPSIKSFDTKGLVIFFGTFSKIFTPGLRIGWVCASSEILERFIAAKQSADLHTSELNQRIIADYLQKYDIENHIEKIKHLYKSRRNVILKAMKDYFPSNVQFTHPAGGLFLWVTLPEHVNSFQVLEKALEYNVAFVPGASFFPNSARANTMRINYSSMSEERILEGIKRLAKVLEEACK